MPKRLARTEDPVEEPAPEIIKEGNEARAELLAALESRANGKESDAPKESLNIFLIE